MTVAEIITIAVSIISGLVGMTALITFVANSKQKTKAEGVKEANLKRDLDDIKRDVKDNLQETKDITRKLENQNDRLTKLEQIVKDTDLSTLPSRITKVEQKAKSAHKRINEIVKQPT